MAQFGYQNLDSLSFNLLNQTKTLAAAVCLYFFLGRKQTPLQLVALALLLTACKEEGREGGGEGGIRMSSFA